MLFRSGSLRQRCGSLRRRCGSLRRRCGSLRLRCGSLRWKCGHRATGVHRDECEVISRRSDFEPSVNPPPAHNTPRRPPQLGRYFSSEPKQLSNIADASVVREAKRSDGARPRHSCRGKSGLAWLEVRLPSLEVRLTSSEVRLPSSEVRLFAQSASRHARRVL